MNQQFNILHQMLINHENSIQIILTVLFFGFSVGFMMAFEWLKALESGVLGMLVFGTFQLGLKLEK
ncbi:hypothetical protein EXW96_18250 [Paenibacillus sp. JMULE4]|uniref:Uncharacterized protein n=1 Tax=Paenibacillus validus TaxID=44253 RepID=A0A7X2ZFN4_9BACL|nr:MULTISPECIES: hypothetical protein [Paenibacillus]MUG73984.1 hypothetical protein [Paenibacillus validus]NTZ19438.1 hypothetical protein [Paenibacillus sp. JMULE4]